MSTYADFSTLAHTPSGTQAEHAIYCFRLNRSDGQLTLMSVVDSCPNAAFMRYSPLEQILYVCTENITANGEVIAYEVDGDTGTLTEVSRQDAGGSSTCYLTIDKNVRHMVRRHFPKGHEAVLLRCGWVAAS